MLNNAGCRGPERTCPSPCQNAPSFSSRSRTGNLLFHPLSNCHLFALLWKQRYECLQPSTSIVPLHTSRRNHYKKTLRVVMIFKRYVVSKSCLKKCLLSCEFENRNVALIYYAQIIDGFKKTKPNLFYFFFFFFFSGYR